MSKKDELEAKLLGEESLDYYEKDLENKLENEINEARKLREKEAQKEKYEVVISDIKLVPPEKRYDKLSIYKVFNRKQKTETYVNGEQAENMIKYTDDYIIKFDHRTEYN